MTYKTLVFDIDDTLIIEKYSVIHGLKAVMAAENINYTDDTFDQWGKIELDFWNNYRAGNIDVPELYKQGAVDEFGRVKSEWIRAQRFRELLSEPITLERAYQLLDIFELAMKERVVPFDGMVDLVKKLSSCYTLLVATDGVHEIADHKLQSIEADGYFSGVFSPRETGHIKPNPAFFDVIFDKFGRNLDDYLIIGNSLSADIRLANNLGIDSCLFNSWRETPKRDNLPTDIVKSVPELEQLLMPTAEFLSETR